MLRKFRAYLLTILLTSVSVFAAAEQTIELFTVDYPPYLIIDDIGSISGTDVEVTIAAFRAVGIPTRISTAPWKRIVKNLQHGRIAGTLSCSKREDRNSYILYSDMVSEISQALITSRSTSLPEEMKVSDMNPFSVVAVEGWGVQKELVQANVPHDTVPDISSGLNAVLFRNVDIFYNGEQTTLYHARQAGVLEKVRAQRLADKESTPLHLCLSKGYPGAAGLIEKFNQGLKQIRASGEYQQIHTRYLGSKE